MFHTLWTIFAKYEFKIESMYVLKMNIDMTEKIEKKESWKYRKEQILF